MTEPGEYTQRRLIGIGRFLGDKRRQLKAGDYDVVAARPGGRLTQEHVAELVGIASVTYQKIEQGKYASLNYDLLRKIMTVLRVPTYQQDLVLLNEPPFPAVTADHPHAFVEPHAVQMVQDMQEVPMMLLNAAHDILAWNAKAADLLLDFEQVPPADRNLLLLTFLHPIAQELLPDIERDASTLVTEVRYNMHRFPSYSARIQALVDRLCEGSSRFAHLWAHEFGLGSAAFDRNFMHRDHGLIRTWVSFMELIASNGMMIVVFTPRDDDARAKFALLGGE